MQPTPKLLLPLPVRPVARSAARSLRTIAIHSIKEAFSEVRAGCVFFEVLSVVSFNLRLTVFKFTEEVFMGPVAAGPGRVCVEPLFAWGEGQYNNYIQRSDFLPYCYRK